MKILQITVLLLLIIMVGCKPEELEYEDYRPIVAVPLIHSTLDVYDVLNRVDSLNEVITIDESGTLALSYQGRLLTLDLAEVISFPEISESYTFAIGSDQATAIDNDLAPQLPTIEIPVDLSESIDAAEVRIDSILLNSGTLSLDLDLDQDEFVNATISSGAILDPLGNDFSLVIAYEDFINGSYTSSVDLSGYTIVPFYTAPDQNSLVIEVELSVSNNPNNTAVQGTFSSGTMSISNLDFEAVFGYFGQVAVNTDQDSVSVRVFENSVDGFFKLEEAEIKLITSNSFGIPVQLGFSELFSLNENTGVETDLSYNGEFVIDGMPNILAEPVVNTFIINEDNSNITDYLEPTPKTLYFELAATCNPDGEPVPPATNFISSGSRLDVDIDVLLPLVGYAQDIIVQDTLETEIDFDEFDEIDSLELKLYTLNGFPADAEIQIEFLDENDQNVDFLFDDGLGNLTTFLNSGVVNDDGIVISPSSATITRSLDQAGADNLALTRKIVVRSRLNTFQSDQENVVRFMDDYELEVKLGVKIFGNVEL